MEGSWEDALTDASRGWFSTEEATGDTGLSLGELFFIFTHASLPFSNLLCRHLFADIVSGVHRVLIAVTRRQADPIVRGDQVRWDALTIEMHEAEIVLRPWLSLFGRALIPLQRFRVALRHALSLVIHQPKVVLRSCFTAMRKKLYVDNRLVVITAKIGFVGTTIFAGCEATEKNEEGTCEQPLGCHLMWRARISAPLR